MKNTSKYGAVTKSLWVNSAVVSKHLDNSLGALHGIGLTEYMVLQSLVNAPDHALRRIDIAEALARTASGITRTLMPMEKRGLVTKERNGRDARVSLVKITSAGEELFEHATITVDSRSEALLKGVGSKRIDSFLEMLDSM